MTTHVAAPVREFPGIDLSFRPRTYFGPLPLATHLLAHVTGQERRELLRARLATVHDDLPAELVASSLDDDTRDAVGRIHPAFMGGEYLPPLKDNETEIARISLASVTADQISVRAQQLREGVAYRIVDEYSNEYVSYQCRPNLTEVPLTLAEIVGMLDGACESGGAVLSHIIANIECGADPEEMRRFVRVSSEFYSQLESYYAHRIASWFEASFPRQDQTEDLN